MDSVKSIVKTSQRFLSGTLLSRVSGMFRDVLMAAAFGTHPSVAAFMVAFRLSNLLRRLFGEGALHSAFVPGFEEIRNGDEKKAFSFFRDLTLTLSLFLCTLIVLVELGLFAFLKWGELSPGNKEICELSALMLPGILFICLYGLFSSLLQCQKKFFAPGIAPLAMNLMWMLGIYLIWEHGVSKAMLELSGFVVLGFFFQWLVTYPQVTRELKEQLPGGIWKGSRLWSEDVKRLVKPLCLGILGVGASVLNNALDAVFSRFAEAEGPAYLWYALRLQQLPLALFGVSLAGALLPPLSRAAKAGDDEAYSKFLNFALSRSFLFMLAATVGIFIFGNSFVQLVYGRGEFDMSTAREVTDCLWAYAPALIPSTWVMVLAAGFYAKGNFKAPVRGAVLSLVSNFVLNALFIFFFGWGAVSVALATSVSAWLNAVYLFYYRHGRL